MAKGILDFKARMTNGGVRPNQFRVTLSFPGIVSPGAAPEKAQYLCFSSSLPGSTVAVAPVQYRGRVVPLAGEREFTPWSLGFYNDDFAIHDAFTSWMNKINDVRTNEGEVNPNVYTSQLLVEQLDRNDKVMKTYTMFDAWPTNVSEIQLDFGQNNQVETFQVQFVYAYWESK